jgi:hypothetical protein
MKYAIIDKNGSITSIVTCQPDDLTHNIPDEHIGIEFDLPDYKYYYKDGFIKIPDMPDRYHAWDKVNQVWSYSQELYDYWTNKDNKALLNSNIVIGDKEYQADTKSLSAMMQQYQLLNMLGGSVKWKLADNTFVELSADDLLVIIKTINTRNQTIISG